LTNRSWALASDHREHADAAPKAQQDTIRLKLAGLHFITGER